MEYIINGTNYNAQCANVDHAIRVSDSIRFEVRQGECREKESGLERAELSSGEGKFSNHQPIIISYSFKVQSGTDLEGVTAIIGQLHAGYRSPNVSFRMVDNDKLKLYLRYGDGDNYTQKVPFVTSIKKDTWYDIALGAVISPDPDGSIELWFQGQKVVDLKNQITGYTQSNSTYWKFGIYRSTSYPPTQIVEYKDVKIMEALKTQSGNDFWLHKGNDSCIVFLHGMDDYKSMDTVLRGGPGRYIKNGWNPPFSVAQVRNIGRVSWTTELIDEFFDALQDLGMKKFALWGWSNGGGGVLHYNGRHELVQRLGVSNYLPKQPNWSNITEPTYLFHASNDEVCPVSMTRNAHANIPQSIYKEYSGGNHSGPQTYTFDPERPDGEEMYNKFQKLVGGGDEIIQNPSIIFNKTKGQITIEGMTFQLVQNF